MLFKQPIQGLAVASTYPLEQLLRIRRIMALVTQDIPPAILLPAMANGD